MIYLIVKEMAAINAPVRVPVAAWCRILGFCKQGYYKWLKQPLSANQKEEAELIEVLRRLHADDPEGGYRVLADASPILATKSRSAAYGGYAG